ncbi:MAG: glycoside hydrolase family 36 protein, partial [Caldimonas sp.]
MKIDPADGSYTIGTSDLDRAVLHAGVAVQLEGRWLQSKDYPRHTGTDSKVSDDLGTADERTVTFSGLSGQPDLIYRLRSYPDQPLADIQVFVRNTTAKSFKVESIRPIAALGNPILDLGGPALEDRVLSDSFSEDRPPISIHDMGDVQNEMPRGVGSQLIYNRQSHQSLFAGALTTDRFLTILRTHLEGDGAQKHIAAYEVDSTGTTELTKNYSLRHSSPEDQVTLQLPVAPGEQLASERLLLSVGTDYHRQLETYGAIIRKLHHARVTAPTPMGWWSWTAYYFGLNAGTALTNARWEARNLKQLGYDFFHIDEGYDYARGEYSTPNATLFPDGVANLERKITGLGLVPGIWTAPFEVSDRSYVFQNHPDWLVHNAKGEPIQIGWITNHTERLFVLDSTNPGAQDYLRKTYTTLVHQWGIRYIKMDFMEDTAVEGYHYRPHTTAMEAQRIGLGIIRQTVGNNVLLDKDGSVMLNPVGYVDFGRISVDTGHTFGHSKHTEPGIAARYYMNRNFFVADPDAFTVSKDMVNDQYWHDGTHPLTLDEAKVSIALAAVSGGMYEIGDDLPILGSEPERLALVQNQDLIDMARLGQSSIPLDLMSYVPEDGQPSLFFLKESPRQSILTIFNWTDNTRTHTVTLSRLGLHGIGTYTVDGVLDKKQTSFSQSSPLIVKQPAHSVRVLKVIDTAIPAQAPMVHGQHPPSAKAGEIATFSA